MKGFSAHIHTFEGLLTISSKTAIPAWKREPVASNRVLGIDQKHKANGMKLTPWKLWCSIDSLLFLCFSIKQAWRDEGVFGKWNSSWLVARLLHPPSLLTYTLHYHTDEFSALHSAFLHCLLCLCIRLSLSLSLCPSLCKCPCLCFCPELPSLQNRTDEFLHYTAEQ